MHSSGMCTVRCSSRLGMGVCLRGGLCVCGGGVCLARWVYTYPLGTESQTGVKTLPFHNFVLQAVQIQTLNKE